MFKRNLWKIVLSLAVLAWAISELLPLHDTPFAQYARTHADKSAEFGKLLDEASARMKAGQAVSEFVGLKQIAKERRIDLSAYFPDIRLEAQLKNIEKRNDLPPVQRFDQRAQPIQAAGDIGRADQRAHGRAADDIRNDAHIRQRIDDADMRPAARGAASQRKTDFGGSHATTLP